MTGDLIHDICPGDLRHLLIDGIIRNHFGKTL
jgi:hypothetical protein